MFFCIHASAAAAAAVNPSSINPLSAYGWSTFFINGKPGFINGQRSLVRTLPDDIIWRGLFLRMLCWSLSYLQNLFAKVLRRLATYLS